MSLRVAACAALVALVAASGAASAAKPKPKSTPKLKPMCKLETDGTNDTFLARYQDTYHKDGVPYGPQEDALDLTSADVATNATTITAVFRLKNLSAPVQTAPGGTSFDFNFTAAGSTQSLYLRAVLAAGAAPTYEIGAKSNAVVTTLATKLADGTGIVDKAKNEIRVSAPLKAIPSGLKRGQKVTVGEITTARYGAGRGVFADVIVGTHTYPAGAASCVPVGK